MFEIFRNPVDVWRTRDGSYVDGRWVEGGPVRRKISASVQPAKPSDILIQEDGRHVSAQFRIYTDDVLKTAAEDKTNPDRVTLNGFDYLVLGIAPWQNNIINHNMYLVGRIEP